ncbi:type VII secretion integral membrane protein EccD [Corynebacterium sp. TAE3-ERU16]|uniref:type VII secretion integral membrane protein EccD n=1 Tax=Corynebacterium sp. TAE3-ERU16 TaxID=2849493 RepID=UPI001C46E1A2|nr:type VII secretion integral membrane protein EccD [Corynebacterium sp. TAE3-ERU16]MBV7292693.1 type VII secretion integral membrane protein EccD [Corynebacterium sp. TAE3-ERU16]
MPYATITQGEPVAVDHALRITVRITPDAVDLHPDAPGLPPPEIDLVLPVHASIAEILPEILDLAGLPGHPGPWVASTAVGVPVETAIPLTHTALRQGGILVLSPGTIPDAPVLRDAAEILSDGNQHDSPRGLGTAAALTGMIACAALAVTGAFPGSDLLPGPLRLGLLGLLCLVVASRISSRENDAASSAITVLVTGVVISSVAAVVTGILGGTPITGGRPDTAVGAAAVGGCLTGAVVLCLCGFCCRVKPEPAAMLATGILLALSGACVFPVARDYPGVAAAVTGFALIGVTLLPSLTIRAAGLTVPRLPPSGEYTGTPEDPDPDVGEHAAYARSLLSGALAGTALLGGSGVLAVGWSGGGFPAALCLTTTIATVLHALRHRDPLAVWALWIWALSGASGTVLAGIRSDSVGVVAVSSVTAVAVLTAPWWGRCVAEFRPVAVNWMERLETLAVAAALPLAAHILGVFALIRGLG